MVPTWEPVSWRPPASLVSQIWKKDHQIPQEAKYSRIVTEPNWYEGFRRERVNVDMVTFRH